MHGPMYIKFINAGLTVLQVLKNLELYPPQKNGSYNSRFFPPRVTEFSLCEPSSVFGSQIRAVLLSLSVWLSAFYMMSLFCICGNDLKARA